MSPALIRGLVGGLLVIAFVANRIFAMTRIPDVVLLMALGVLLGRFSVWRMLPTSTKPPS